MHAAALCSTTKNLEVLKEINYDFKKMHRFNDRRWSEVFPIQLAIVNDLVDNMKFIIEMDKEFFMDTKFKFV